VDLSVALRALALDAHALPDGRYPHDLTSDTLGFLFVRVVRLAELQLSLHNMAEDVVAECLLELDERRLGRSRSRRPGCRDDTVTTSANSD
jgi:hypothetical protein